MAPTALGLAPDQTDRSLHDLGGVTAGSRTSAPGARAAAQTTVKTARDGRLREASEEHKPVLDSPPYEEERGAAIDERRDDMDKDAATPLRRHKAMCNFSIWGLRVRLATTTNTRAASYSIGWAACAWPPPPRTLLCADGGRGGCSQQ